MSGEIRETDLLVVGGGAAGLSAAAEAASYGAKVIVLDSDLHLGGQLVKQTHKFFGSKDEHAGTRGYKIADIIMDEIGAFEKNVELHTNTSAVGYYKNDGIVTVMHGEDEYYKILPKKMIMATGAQERIIPFPNNDLPGVYGAGAVQTLMNVYGVVPGKRVLMIGAGNIGLIVSYQLMQAGVEVAAVLEALPKIGGYWVHASKIRRLGVPIMLRHTIKAALGADYVDGAVIQNIDTGELQHVECDVICLAVGLTPTNEMLWQAGCDMRFVPQLCGHVPARDENLRTSNQDVWVAGDAGGIEEASAAMIEGRIAGLSAAESLGLKVDDAKKAVYHERLDALRRGEVGEKIRLGLAQVAVDDWRDK
jgi:sarcosine oxidase subunit alpha